MPDVGRLHSDLQRVRWNTSVHGRLGRGLRARLPNRKADCTRASCRTRPADATSFPRTEVFTGPSASQKLSSHVRQRAGESPKNVAAASSSASGYAAASQPSISRPARSPVASGQLRLSGIHRRLGLQADLRAEQGSLQRGQSDPRQERINAVRTLVNFFYKFI